MGFISNQTKTLGVICLEVMETEEIFMAFILNKDNNSSLNLISVEDKPHNSSSFQTWEEDNSDNSDQARDNKTSITSHHSVN